MKRAITLIVACMAATIAMAGVAVASAPSYRDDFRSFNEDRWYKGDHKLGRSNLEPSNVNVVKGELRLRLPANTTNGGELVSNELHGYGSYAARIKVPRAPSSITGFFLYRAPDRESEIDIEIFNDRSRRVMFTSYKDGKKVTDTVRLPFYPTRGFHNYRFDHSPRAIKFYVDGKLRKRIFRNVPNERMYLLTNAWYPRWLPGHTFNKTKGVRIEWIRHIQR
jgi:beta-glucanase (GH16 family)